MPNPSPWLGNRNPEPHASASFVEYLRWMRSLLNEDQSIDAKVINSGTVLELFQKLEASNLSETLAQRIETTKKIAKEYFEVRCPWRIRVGGIRGPESMLLPAFDSLGIPFIPSSTLKGVARAVATLDPDFTKAEIEEIFGDISSTSSMGKVIFLDAYPLPGIGKQGGLKPDMANSIWKWKNDDAPEYNTNPNIFLSLEKPTFVVGLRDTKNCSIQILNQTKQWLFKGLTQGIGSRVNSGYGSLVLIKNPNNLELTLVEPVKRKLLLKVPFELRGQLIHGSQYFDLWERNNNGNKWRSPGKPRSEVRPVAFRSVLRYWFRVFSLGVLSSPRVRELEMKFFGGIDGKSGNKNTGLFRLEVNGSSIDQEPKEGIGEYGLLGGTLSFYHSIETPRLSNDEDKALVSLLRNLTWLMFHLGGVGQGARRPCYRRNSNPFWRGSTLEVKTIQLKENAKKFWEIPRSIPVFRSTFNSRIRGFYNALKILSGDTFDEFSGLTALECLESLWAEAVDSNCQIFIIQSLNNDRKPFSLDILHEYFHQLERNNLTYAGYLCGMQSVPSPIWISSIGMFQVVTVFGATQNPRKEYISRLCNAAGEENWTQVFPLSKG